MDSSAGCTQRRRGERMTSWRSPQFKAAFLLLIYLIPVAAFGVPADKLELSAGLSGWGDCSETKAGGIGGAMIGAGNEQGAAQETAHGTLVTSTTDQQASSETLIASYEVVLWQLSSDKTSKPMQESIPQQAATDSKASPSQQHHIRPAAHLTMCPANTSDKYTHTRGSAFSVQNKPTDLSYAVPELVKGRSLIDLPQTKQTRGGIDLDAGRIASASLSFFDWSRRRLLDRQLELERLDTDSETASLEQKIDEGLLGDEESDMKGKDVSNEREFSRKGWAGADFATPAVAATEEDYDSSITASPFRKNKVLEEAKAAPILRLTHRAKTERQIPPSSVHTPFPPGTKSAFSSLDHEHLLAADAARRTLISSSKIALGGSTVPLGYYFAEIALGTPPQRFQMIVDTGSAIMYVPAKGCVSCGGSHESPPYDHGASSTYTPHLCSAATCTASTPATCPSPDSPCLYQQHYSEGSSTSGTVAIDVLSLPGVLGVSKIMFGCETRETGLLYTQTADGIIGLGRGPGSIIAQLAQQRVVEDAFSLCFGGVEGGGAMVFGSVGVLPGTVWVPMLPQTSTESMYFADVYGLQVGGSAVSLDSASVPVTAMVDSGTTYTYLPSALYGPLVARLLQAIPHPLVPVPKRSLSAACWGKVPSVTGPASTFPTLGLVFANGIVVEVPPDNYLFKHPILAGAYCLGIFSSGQHGATLGGISVHNLLVTYDRAHQLFGFARLNCSAVADGSLTLPKPQTSFPSLNAPNKTRYTNTSAPTYARIPFRTANIPAMNASSLTSARARDPVPNPWAATLEGLLYDDSESPSPAPAPVEAVPGSGLGKRSPETDPPVTTEKAGSSAKGNEATPTGASPGHKRPNTWDMCLCAVMIVLMRAVCDSL